MSTLVPQPTRKSSTIMCGLVNAISNTQKREEERKKSADHDHAKNELDDGARCPATDSGSASLS
jgi:hypothetical protein